MKTMSISVGLVLNIPEELARELINTRSHNERAELLKERLGLNTHASIQMERMFSLSYNGVKATPKAAVAE